MTNHDDAMPMDEDLSSPFAMFPGDDIDTGYWLMGNSGIGTSSAVESVLSPYPQAVNRDSHHPPLFITCGVIWMKFKYSGDRTVKELIFSYFQALDQLFSTNDMNSYNQLGEVTTEEDEQETV